MGAASFYKPHRSDCRTLDGASPHSRRETVYGGADRIIAAAAARRVDALRQHRRHFYLQHGRRSAVLYAA